MWRGGVLLGLALIRLDMHVAARINFMSVFVVVNCVSP